MRWIDGNEISRRIKWGGLDNMGCIRNVFGDFHNATVWSWKLVYFWL